ncbi:LysR family transcriptional regulator [Plastorhodobacter daqingensis]|uniref:LysR family transcriptional regulator n=1 Tax=Plastorhodobacter daqingensis TaxID=1387281 RepID=A0ABW2UM27_9RHOB
MTQERLSLVPPEDGPGPGADLTLRKLRAFWAVANAPSLTAAAKMLGIAQPSLSQQITGLEKSIGQPLFERRSNQMVLTNAGRFLLRRCEEILRSMQDLEDGLAAFCAQQRHPLRLAGVESLLRTLLPVALARMESDPRRLDCDLLEGAPADILELLYARRVDIGLLAANSIADACTGFLQIPLTEDPMVLVVPDWLDLGDLTSTEPGLVARRQAVLDASIRISFGTQHTHRIADWYLETLPRNRVVAQVRSFETALSMVREGLGICVVPALSVVAAGQAAARLRFYHSGLAARRIVALIQPALHRTGRYDSLLDGLRAAASQVVLPPIAPLPALFSVAPPAP